jgi:hypothetical protein
MECKEELLQQGKTQEEQESIDNKVSFLITMSSILEEEGGTAEDKLLLSEALIQRWIIEENISQERKNRADILTTLLIKSKKRSDDIEGKSKRLQDVRNISPQEMDIMRKLLKDPEVRFIATIQAGIEMLRRNVAQMQELKRESITLSLLHRHLRRPGSKQRLSTKILQELPFKVEESNFYFTVFVTGEVGQIIGMGVSLGERGASLRGVPINIVVVMPNQEERRKETTRHEGVHKYEEAFDFEISDVLTFEAIKEQINALSTLIEHGARLVTGNARRTIRRGVRLFNLGLKAEVLANFEMLYNTGEEKTERYEQIRLSTILEDEYLKAKEDKDRDLAQFYWALRLRAERNTKKYRDKLMEIIDIAKKNNLKQELRMAIALFPTLNLHQVHKYIQWKASRNKDLY